MIKIKSLFDLPKTKDYLQRIGAEPRSIRTAVIKEHFGAYYKDLAVIKFSKDGKVDVSSAEYQPTENEAVAIADECKSVQWPVIQPISHLIDMPKMMAEAAKKDVFEFRNAENQIVMVQVRIIKEDGDKHYVPWTYWDDGEWRCMEPDTTLPLFNLHKMKEAATVFIHEGAKAARHVQWMVDGETEEARKALAAHPWGLEITGAVHLGWIGGAMSPSRTDWSVIARSGVRRVYIVADNDDPGRSAVPKIAQYVKLPTFAIQFTDEFPASFDMADEFPEKMFGNIDGGHYYVGPQFRECLHPATWATDAIPNEKGRPTIVLRDSFKNMWAYVEEADAFVCTEMPEIVRTEAVLNKIVAPFSHVSDTARLIVKAYRGRSTRICYRPDQEGLTVTFRGSSAINLHTPSNIKSRNGNPALWLEFLDYMFVNADERNEVEKWCATLIARPDIRMGYGLLLISERQGVGKTTLGGHILGPLVGVQNVGHPGESDIVSAFNDWMANKRLVIVNEIYSGSSWKAYHALKSVITDRDVTVNQKYMRQYTIENWTHVLACSNSMRALKMENDDRRWFYPEVTEIPWPRHKFVEFRRWIEEGGLGVIKSWAKGYGDYVQPSDVAPMTERKREMIDGSRSDAQKEAAALASFMNEHKEPVALLTSDVVAWVKKSVSGRVFESDYELRKAMTESGVYSYPKRIKVYGRLQYVILNEALQDISKRTPSEKEVIDIIREKIVKPSDILVETM